MDLYPDVPFEEEEAAPPARDDHRRNARFARAALAEKLNPPQVEAVLHPAAPLLIVAGAGSGKTRVITYRLARLLAEGASPQRSFIVTFTNKAAKELRARATALLGDGRIDVRGLWLGTFHSLSARLLRVYGEAIGIRKDFVIYDTDDQKRLLTRVMADLGVSDRHFPVRQVQWAIDEAQNRGVDAAHFEAGDYFSDVVAKVFKEYARRMRASNAVDFGGLLLSALDLCRPDSPAMEELASRFDHVLVDEFQDTNQVQYRLVRFLSHAGRSITVVGDEDQSIYKWRGADIRNIRGFETDHPGCGVVKLEQNYRSTGNVLRAANAIIARNPQRRGKNLFTKSGPGDSIVVYEGETERDEAEFVASTIDETLKQGAAPRDFAVFYRTNGQSRVLEESLRAHDLPYVVVGGVRFFDRTEVKDLLSYLRVLQNPADSVGLARIINVPTRGIGNTTLLKLADLARERDVSMWAALEAAASEPEVLAAGTRAKIAAFLEMMRKLRTAVDTEGPAALAERVLEESGYRDALAGEASLESEGRIENLLELVAQMREYEGAAARDGEEISLAGFLERVALVADIDSYDPDKGAVSLMTVHTAKGLEFPRVFVTGLEDGVFPHQRSVEDDEQLEEERRLCYVAVTRAMERLFLTRVRRRRLSGQVLSGMASRFLRDVPAECCENLIQPRPSYYDVDAQGSGPWEGGWSRGGGASGSDARPARAGGPRSFVPDEAPGRGPAAAASRAAPGELTVEYDDDASSELGLRVGARLRHPKFGVGEVRGWQSAGADLKVTMRFPGTGVKTILARFLSKP